VAGAAAIAVENVTVTGTFSGNPTAIPAAAFAYNVDQIDSLLASAPAMMPAAGKWTATLQFTVPQGKRLVIRAVAFNPKGKVVGHAARRRRLG